MYIVRIKLKPAEFSDLTRMFCFLSLGMQSVIVTKEKP